ncbi:unnamed protein product [Adineta ricciae]|uniref:Uncharacterized protein n=1 Tax=Adineta ricciae TaxID=249248 RepID=A0A815LIM7_ADIRI|nr:unnamed protein product [Adineta ricciae]CAF1404716.1 unnamed protein product [Adineta ricciae]
MSSDEAPNSIIQLSLRALPLTTISIIPSPASLAKTVRRQCPMPCSTSTSQLRGIFRKTDRGEDFVLYEDNQMIIFATTINLSLLRQCKHWFVDGVFKACSEDFYQLFTVHALLKSVVIPLIYGLLIGKSADDY